MHGGRKYPLLPSCGRPPRGPPPIRGVRRVLSGGRLAEAGLPTWALRTARMTGGAARARSDAAVMPSWSASNSPSDKLATPPGTGAATAVERVRRLLEQVFAGQPQQPHDSAQALAGRQGCRRTIPTACAADEASDQSSRPRPRARARTERDGLPRRPDRTQHRRGVRAVARGRRRCRARRRQSWCSSSGPGRRLTRTSGRRCSTPARRRYTAPRIWSTHTFRNQIDARKA